MSAPLRRLLSIAFLSLTTAVVAATLLVTPASAHNVLVASTPAEGETLAELPPEFSVTTNEPMLALPGSQGFVLQIRDATGDYYGDGCVEVVDATMWTTPALGAPGDYTMLWQAVSADGHSIDGEIAFTWAPEAGVDADSGSSTPPVCGQAATPTPESTESAVPAPGEQTAEPAPASGIDLVTLLWIGGALLAAGIAATVAIAIAGRRKT
jgi:methionine-rich copper-binding protein CopC